MLTDKRQRFTVEKLEMHMVTLVQTINTNLKFLLSGCRSAEQ